MDNPLDPLIDNSSGQRDSTERAYQHVFSQIVDRELKPGNPIEPREIAAHEAERLVRHHLRAGKPSPLQFLEVLDHKTWDDI